MRKYALLVAGLLTACVNVPNRPALAKAELVAEYTCQDRAFWDISDCITAAFDQNYPRWRADPNSDLINIMVAWLDAESMRIARGDTTEQEARTRGHMLQERLDQVAYQRRVQAQINAQITSQMAATMMLSGLAMVNAAQPQNYAGAPIICNTTGNYRLSTTICR